MNHELNELIENADIVRFIKSRHSEIYKKQKNSLTSSRDADR
jgi:hypothetical protein